MDKAANCCRQFLTTAQSRAEQEVSNMLHRWATEIALSREFLLSICAQLLDRFWRGASLRGNIRIRRPAALTAESNHTSASKTSNHTMTFGIRLVNLRIHLRRNRVLLGIETAVPNVRINLWRQSLGVNPCSHECKQTVIQRFKERMSVCAPFEASRRSSFCPGGISTDGRRQFLIPANRRSEKWWEVGGGELSCW